MSGLEAAGLAAASKFTGAIAASAARKVFARVTGRWRLRRRVKAQVAFDIPPREFRRWLKEITPEDLSGPPEQAAPALAAALDQALASDPSWRGRPERMSEALNLVLAVYRSVLELAGEGDARTLVASWDKARHEELIASLAAASPGLARLSSVDRAALLERQSRARQYVRLQAFGLSWDQLRDALAIYDSLVPPVDSGSVLVLVGPFGSGKSELAEAWFRQRLAEYKDASGVLPVWLRAGDLTDQKLEAAVRSQLPIGDADQLAVSLVVDGLDEIDSRSADRIIHDTQTLAATYPEFRALMTARPGTLPDGVNTLAHEGLPADAGVGLVQVLLGSDLQTHGWPPELRDAVRRPFFALAAGMLLREGQRFTGEADLIARLVELALRQQRTAELTLPPEIFSLLTRLAVATTDSGNRRDGLTFAERERALRSTLVTKVGDHVEFSLPIFQQWFAAESIKADVACADRLAAAPATFDRWRWALAIAALDQSDDFVDELLVRVMRNNPGAASWIITRSAGRHHWWDERALEPLDAATASDRVLRAARAWVDGLSPLSPAFLPVGHPGNAIGIGVRVKERWLNLGWQREAPPSDHAVELPAEVSVFSGEDTVWIPLRGGQVVGGALWPWELFQSLVAGRMIKVLEGRALARLKGTVWQMESRLRAARVITNTRVTSGPVRRDRAAAAAADMLARDFARWRLPSGQVDRWEVEDVYQWLSQEDSEHLPSPLPPPDQPNFFGPASLVTDAFSGQGLQSYLAEVYGLGCLAYDEACTIGLPRFSWSLSTGEPGKFGVLAELHHDPAAGGNGPSLCFTRLPLDVLHPVVDSEPSEWHPSHNRRAFVRLAPFSGKAVDHSTFSELAEVLAAQTRGQEPSNPFRDRSSITYTSRTYVRHARPASQVAAAWLSADMKALGLLKGTFPNLDR